MATKKKPAGRPGGVSTWMRNSVLVVCALGICVSAYALYVEISKHRDPSFRALCDFSETMSCSKVFTSRWGRGFGLVELVAGPDSWLNQPNSVFGMAFYTFLATLAFDPSTVGAVVQLGAVIFSNIGSVYLAYVLFFVLQDVCVVCISMYIINFTLLVLSVIKFRNAAQNETRKRR